MSESSDHCPLCDADLRGAEIPEKSRHLFGEHTHFSRVLGNYDMTLDRTVSWSCPDCEGTWTR